MPLFILFVLFTLFTNVSNVQADIGPADSTYTLRNFDDFLNQMAADLDYQAMEAEIIRLRDVQKKPLQPEDFKTLNALVDIYTKRYGPSLYKFEIIFSYLLPETVNSRHSSDSGLVIFWKKGFFESFFKIYISLTKNSSSPPLRFIEQGKKILSLATHEKYCLMAFR